MLTQAIGLALVGTAGIHGTQQLPKIQNKTIVNRTLLVVRNTELGNTTITSPVGLWLTNAPSLSSKGLVVIPNNITLKVTGQQNGWYNVSYDGQTGWIDGQYTSGLSNVGNGQSVSTKNTKNSLNSVVRGQLQIKSPIGLYMAAGPNTQSNLGVAVPYNTKLIFTAEKNGWYRVSYSGEVGWVDGQYVTVLNNNSTKNNINTNSSDISSKEGNAINLTVSVNSFVGLWMNAGPGANTSKLICLPDNTILNATNEENGWYKVSYNGQVGWIDSQYTNIVKKQQQSQSSSVSKGELEIASPIGLWMGTGPNAQQNLGIAIPYNTKLIFTAEKDGWYKVNYGGEVGWVDGQYVNLLSTNNKNYQNPNTVQPIANSSSREGILEIINIHGARAYVEPNDNGESTLLSYKTRFRFIKEQNGWYKIDFAGSDGWVDGQYVKIIRSFNYNNAQNNQKNVYNINNKIASNGSNQTVTITSPVGLWMNMGAGAESGQIICIPYNSTVRVIGQQNNWYEVDYQGMIGWIDSQYTSKLTSQVVSETLTIASPIGLWMNENATPFSQQIICVPYNAKVTVLGESCGWYKVQYQNNIGWVDGQFVTIN